MTVILINSNIINNYSPRLTHGYIAADLDTSKIVLLVVIGIVGIALVAFVVHTIRCYLNKPSVD